MEILWSPWRSKYISTFKEEKKNKVNICFLCDAVNSNEFTSENLLVFRTELSIVLLNRYPYNSGHLLIATNHTGDFINLPNENLLDIMINVQKAVMVLNDIYQCHGFNIGANLGRAAGAGVPDHIHYHVIPRWNGDVNFIQSVSDTKIMSESLENSYIKIKETFEKFESLNWKN
jgi:ATP adenylyltransferase